MARKITGPALNEATGELIRLSRAYDLEDGDTIQT